MNYNNAFLFDEQFEYFEVDLGFFIDLKKGVFCCLSFYF